MARLKTYANTGPTANQLLPSDLNALQDEYELSFATYKELVRRGGTPAAGIVAGTYALHPNEAATQATPLALDYVFYLQPADYAAAGTGPTPRTTKCRVRAQLFANSTASATTWTVGLYPVSTFGAGATPQATALGAVVTGSTVAFATPAANSQATLASTDFSAPAAGYYVLAVANAATAAAGAVVFVQATLQMRNT